MTTRLNLSVINLLLMLLPLTDNLLWFENRPTQVFLVGKYQLKPIPYTIQMEWPTSCIRLSRNGNLRNVHGNVINNKSKIGILNFPGF